MTADDEEPPGDDEKNLAEPGQVKKRQTKQQLREKEDRLWISSVLAAEAGRRWLWALISDSGAFTAPFGVSPNGFPNHESTWFLAGRQAYGLNLYHQLLRLDPVAVFAMHRENDPNFVNTKEIK